MKGSSLQFGWTVLVGTLWMIREIRGVRDTHQGWTCECMWVGAGGEVGKSAYKINVSVYFSDYMPFFIRDAGTDP